MGSGSDSAMPDKSMALGVPDGILDRLLGSLGGRTDPGSNMGDAMVKTSVTFHPSKNPDTIWNKLKEKLGREPTEEEARQEVLRILREE